MIKYVKAESLEDVEREYQAVQKQYEEDKKVYDEQFKRYNDAVLADKKSIQEFVKEKVHSVVGSFPEHLTVTTSDYDYKSRGYNVLVQYAWYGPYDVSLGWEWRVSINAETGEVEKESNSWSGLKMTTVAELDDLKTSVKIMESLMSITDEDWKRVLDIDMPRYSDYVEKRLMTPDPGYWENRRNMARLSSVTGNPNKAVSVSDSDFYSTKHYASINRETPKRYEVSYYDKSMRLIDTVQVSKDKFLKQLEKPIEIVDVQVQE